MKQQKHKKTKRRKQKKQGGSLCNPPYDINKPENDIYTLDAELSTHEYTDIPVNIYTDALHPDVIIKIVQNPHEYKILKLLEHTGFTPKIYGFYKCNGDPAKLKSFQRNSKMYIVMEKLEGHDLLELVRGPAGLDILNDHIEEIYLLYNILMDKGFINTDLFLQNIILSHGKIYFIDFEYVINTQSAIALTDRLSIQQLKETLIRGKKIKK
jgi:serine/threonine protein kinase